MRIRVPLLLVLIGTLLVAPPAADAAKRKAPAKFYGTMWDKEIQDASPEIYEQEWAKMALNGVETTRVIFSWNLAQEQQGTTTWKYTDPMVTAASRHGIELLPIVTYAPPWARVHPSELGSAPSNYQAYADFLKLVIARYGPGGEFWDENPSLPYRPVRYWQIWNEPGVLYQWSPQDNWPQRYGELLKLAYSTVKQADPGAKVVLAGLANASWEEMDALYDQGGVKGFFDIAAVHYYARVTSQFLEVTQRLRASMNAHGDKRVPLWWTEAGASASKDRIQSPGNEHFQTTDEGLARQLTATYKLFIRYRNKLRIGRVYWYTWASSYSTSAGAFDFSGMNIFDGQSVTAKPSLAAYRKSARTYEGCKKDQRARCVRR